MDWQTVRLILIVIQHTISFLGVLVILSGVLIALFLYVRMFFFKHKEKQGSEINQIRMVLGRRLILGLEFIVSADLIGTTTTPDYYSLGILGAIVLIRTLLSFSLNRELMALSKEK
jgi:uncharacterized membrane protein